MEKQTLPNSTLILVLGILSICTSCCYGFGILLGGIAVYLANKSTLLYKQNPDQYKGIENIKAGKITGIIGIVFGIIILISLVSFINSDKYGEFMDQYQDILEQYQQ